ncbi:MAG: RHS repeat-associated core domain-containing protein, partial [Vulcanimicrobiaceae bacterium]
QGVRSYDTQAGIWTSPDAYAGTVNDPATQKSYMWNNNNPISYSDPSGYDPEEGEGEGNQETLPPEEDDQGGKTKTQRILTGQRYLDAQQKEVDKQLGVPDGAPKISNNADRLGHMFRDDPAKGHVPDSPTNRALFRKTGAIGRVIKRWPYGTVEKAAKLPSGNEVWVRVLHDVIINGGINVPPLHPGLEIPNLFP